jgi:hypothetical protein
MTLSVITPYVIPAEAGIQKVVGVDSRIRGNDRE